MEYKGIPAIFCFEKKGEKIDFNKLLSINSDTVGWIKYNQNKVNNFIVKTNDNEFKNFIVTIRKISYKKVDIDVNINDNILTLSTCYGTGGTTKRRVIHAKRVYL